MLEADGFASLPAFARDSEVAQLRAAVAARLDGSHEGACERSHRPSNAFLQTIPARIPPRTLN
jgi:hypothetical protein